MVEYNGKALQIVKLYMFICYMVPSWDLKSADSWSRIHECTISLRFLGIIWKAVRVVGLWIAKRKTLKTFVPITSKNPAFDHLSDYRGIISMLVIFIQYTPLLPSPPPPPSRPIARRVCTPSAFGAGGGHTRWAERGVGSQYFGRRQTQLCTLHK